MSEVGSSHSSYEVGDKPVERRGRQISVSRWEARGAQEVRKGVEQEQKDIRYQSRTYKKLQTLMNRVNAESIKEEHRKQVKGKAAGIDGITKEQYDAKLEENVNGLIERMKKFSYRPLPVRRTYIPKLTGGERPLGIPAYEDKLVQAVMSNILSDVYEERFTNYSYGYRPNRSAHDAVRVINNAVGQGKVGYVLEADIKGFFDNVSHDWLMKFLENDIEDKNFLRYIKRFLIAGIMEGTEILESDKGTPQGGPMSPVLANVYLHYVLDLWYEKFLKGVMEGETHYVRFADDFAMLFQHKRDAENAMSLLIERLAKFGLEVAGDKTRILPFGRFKGTKEDFDFVGFTFFNAKTRAGKYRLGIRTSSKKLKAKRAAVKAWLRTRLTKPIAETMTTLNRALQGHYNYYGVSGNSIMLAKFTRYAQYTCYRMFNRRDQKGKMKVDVFYRIWTYYIKPPRLTVDLWNGWKPKMI